MARTVSLLVLLLWTIDFTFAQMQGPESGSAEPVFVVNSPYDETDDVPGDGVCYTGRSLQGHDECTLRAAIEEANAIAATSTTIQFSLAGTKDAALIDSTNGLWILKPGFSSGGGSHGALPPIHQPNVHIDGLAYAFDPGGEYERQPHCGTLNDGSPHTLVVVLDGSLLTSSGHGLHFAPDSDGSSVSGLVIQNFPENGVALDTTATSVSCSYIGTTFDGFGGAANRDGIFITNDEGSTVDNNLVSGNVTAGIYISGASSTRVRGNLIGTDVSGTTSSQNLVGIMTYHPLSDVTVGGSMAAHRNIISGNESAGLHIFCDAPVSGVPVRTMGNYVGTNLTGTAALPNGEGVHTSCDSTVVGGAVSGEGNVVSGNAGPGIFVFGDAVSILGNFVGLNRTGSAAIPNGDHGIHVFGDFTQIGLDNGSSGNLISGNLGAGVRLEGGPGVALEGNRIGTDVSGITGIGNGRHGVEATAPVTIRKNQISANAWAGVFLGIFSDSSSVAGNLIGTNATGVGPLGNRDGILTGIGDVMVGGTVADDANTIAFNTQDGVAIGGQRISVLGNSIFQNGNLINHLGIDLLGNDGVDINDGVPDADYGANTLLNYPTGLSVMVNAPSPTVELEFTIESIPDTNYRIEFFQSPAFDASGHGEGAEYVGFLNRSTDGTGIASISTTVSSVLFPFKPGYFATATATLVDDGGEFHETSEFSVATQITGPEISLDGTLLLEGPYAGSGLMSAGSPYRTNTPTLQPFSDPRFDGSLAEYDGLEFVDAIPAGVMDWIVLALRSSPGVEVSGSRRVAFLHQDGTMLNLDGFSPFVFNGPVPGSYYVVACHANHLCAMSDTLVDFSSGSAMHDFTTGASYPGAPSSPTLSQADLGDGRFGLYAGNTQPDTAIDESDFVLWENDTAEGTAGYWPTDCNLSGATEALDFNLILANMVAGVSSQVP